MSSSSYNLRPTSYSPAHLDRELALRGAHTSGSVERKRERLQRFVEAQQNSEPQQQVVVEEPVRRAPVAPLRRSSRVAEQHTASAPEVRRSSRVAELQRTVVNLPEVRRSSRIAALLNEYLGY